MVMEASGSSERKYCHCSGGGQRLMRTSLRLMDRSTERFTTTGTNSEPPCCEEDVHGCYALGLIPGTLVPKGTPPHLNSRHHWQRHSPYASPEVASEPPSHHRKLSTN